MRLPRELWMMILEEKRGKAWRERKERVWDMLDQILPVKRVAHEELGLFYFITPNVMFMVEVPDIWEWDDRGLYLIVHQNIRWPPWQFGLMFKTCPSMAYSE